MIQSVNDIMPKGLRLYEPGTYRITVQGTLDKRSWSDWLEEGTINTHATDRGMVTTLTCSFRDQAALLGFLNALYDWHFPLLQVEYLPDPVETARESEQ